MEATGLFFVTWAIVIFVVLFIQASFLLWGAKLADISGRTYARAFGTLILSAIASALLAWPLSSLPIIGFAGSSIGGFLITALIMMALFDTSFGKALAATVIAWVLGIVVFGGFAILIIILAGGLAGQYLLHP